MKVELIAVDLDGTLLDPEDHVTPATIKAVARARAAGLPVIPVTGRPERLIWDVAVEAGLGPLGVGVNGAVILDLESGSVLERHGFSGHEAVAVVDVVRDRVPGIALAVDEGELFAYEPGLLRGLDTVARRGRVAHDDVRGVAALGCLKLVARHADLTSLELAAIVSPALRELAEVTASDIAWIDIGPPGLSKATGLRDVCQRLGVTLHEAAAIGDHFNDLPMLEAVGVAAAMANAIPDVLAIADRVLPSNADDGVAMFINDIIDGAERPHRRPRRRSGT